MSKELQADAFLNPELSWYIKQQLVLVRTKITTVFNWKRADVEASNLLMINDQKELQVEEKIPDTDNEILNLYYLEGMKLFNQGKFANRTSKKEDELGVYL
ncbi:MAG: hypothetical protein SGJ00_15200 [bacterium]|nr:hypothetical protein [bacterium]